MENTRKTAQFSPLKYIIMLMMMTCLYFFLAHGSILFARLPDNVSVFWIPTGFSIALLIHFGLGFSPALILGKLLYELSLGRKLDLILLSTLASFTEAYVGYFLFHSFKKNIEDFFEYQSNLVLMATVAFLSPVISAMIGVSSLLYFKIIPEDQYFSNWISWYAGDALGAFIFLPAFAYSHLAHDDGENNKFSLRDLVAPVIAVFVTGLFSFPVLTPYIFLLFGVLLLPIWIGTERSLYFTLMAVALMLNIFQFRHIGPFSAGTYQENLTSMQFFLFALGFTALALVGFKRTKLFSSALFPLITFWILTGSVYFYYHTQKDMNDEKNLDATIAEFNSRLSEKLHFLKSTIQGVAGFVTASSEITEDEWNEYIGSLSLVSYRDGVRSINLIYPEAQKKLNRYYQMSVISSDLRLDLPSNRKKAQLHSAMNDSLIYGQLKMTEPERIVIDRGYTAVSYLVMPVFRNEDFVGHIVVTMEINRILQTMIENGFQNADIDVYAGEKLNAKNLIYRNVVDPRFRNNRIDPEKISIIEMAGVPVSVYWNETSRFISLHNSQNSFFVLIGAIFSLVVTGFYLHLRLLNFKAQKLADKKTRELTESEARFRALFNNSSDAVILFNEQRIMDCNPKALELFDKQTKSEMLATHLPSLFYSEEDPGFFRNKMQEVKDEQMLTFEANCLRSTEKFIGEVHLHYLVVKERTLYQAVVRDITDRKNIEANLIRSKDLAEEAARTKSQFLSTMSHEIRTPLNGVIGMIDVILDEHPDLPIQDDLNTIKYSADNLLHVLNKVLDFSKIEAGKMVLEKKAFSLVRMCSNLVKVYRSKAASKGIKLDLHIDSACPEWIVGDEVRNTQVLHNLLSNAVKFTNQGEISLDVSVLTLKKDYVELRFSVHDTGIGIDEDKKKAVFDEFTQAESDHTRKFGGTGLGLAISKRLIEIQKGQLELKSTPGKGTTFTYALTFTLPDSNFATGSPREIPEKICFNGQKVLLVEDNEINVQVTRKFLERWGLVVDIAVNGREAVERARQTEYDLILMDLHMPVMGGLEATTLIRTFNSVIPIIGLSADVMADFNQHQPTHLMNDFVTKPFIPEEFLQKLHRYLSLS